MLFRKKLRKRILYKNPKEPILQMLLAHNRSWFLFFAILYKFILVGFLMSQFHLMLMGLLGLFTPLMYLCNSCRLHLQVSYPNQNSNEYATCGHYGLGRESRGMAERGKHDFWHRTTIKKTKNMNALTEVEW